MATKKTKKPGRKKKKDQDADAPKHEVDAVKSYIYVMLVFILALGVFLFIRLGDLDEVQTDLANLKSFGSKVRSQSQEIQAYLDLIKNSQETVLMKNPTQFFTAIYRGEDIRIQDKNVTIPPMRDQKNLRDRYTEYYWDIDIRSLNRKQAAHFMHGVESLSPKAKSIDASLRRNDKDKTGEDSWDATFRVGYRTALAK